MVSDIFYLHKETTVSIGKASATDGTNARTVEIFQLEPIRCLRPTSSGANFLSLFVGYDAESTNNTGVLSIWRLSDLPPIQAISDYTSSSIDFKLKKAHI